MTQTTDVTDDVLSVVEQAGDATQIKCKPCQDWRTDVSHGVEHPCRHCQPMRFLAWRLAFEGEGIRLRVGGVECVVELPPAGGSIVQPCEGQRCEFGCVLVTPDGHGAGARWVDLGDVEEVLTPWTGA